MADAEVAGLERQAHSLQARADALQADLAQTERRQRLEELERQSREAERERDTQRLYGGALRSQRDLEGLQKNIEGTAARISALETSILEAMERADDLKRQLTEARAALAAVAQGLEARRQQVRARLAEIDRLLPLRATERAAAARAVNAAVLREYERVRARSGGVALAPVAGGHTCGACGIELSALLLARLRRGGQAVPCEQCGRLLVATGDGAASGTAAGVPEPSPAPARVAADPPRRHVRGPGDGGSRPARPGRQP